MSEQWRERGTMIVHYVPESEDFEGGYEAVTMLGVPHNVSVTGSDRDSAEGALRHLIDGLRAFGFRGRVGVEDATSLGRVERYEVQAG